MVPILAKQAVNKKMEFKASKLLGAYEFFYAAGFLGGYMGLSLGKELPPEEIQENIRANSGAITNAKDDILYLYNQFVQFSVEDMSKVEDKDVLEGLFEDGYLDGGKRQ